MDTHPPAAPAIGPSWFRHQLGALAWLWPFLGLLLVGTPTTRIGLGVVLVAIASAVVLFGGLIPMVVTRSMAGPGADPARVAQRIAISHGFGGAVAIWIAGAWQVTSVGVLATIAFAFLAAASTGELARGFGRALPNAKPASSSTAWTLGLLAGAAALAAWAGAAGVLEVEILRPIAGRTMPPSEVLEGRMRDAASVLQLRLALTAVYLVAWGLWRGGRQATGQEASLGALRAELSRALAGGPGTIRGVGALAASAAVLERNVAELDASSVEQNELLTNQAAALQETQVTAQEIKQTSVLAAQKAELVLRQVETADRISRTGESAIEQSLNGLEEIGKQVSDMASHIRSLDQRAQQVASITLTVKDLADQSNMLALNAAIEAVRSGEQGKGFGVVAREIRTLADQSLVATRSVRQILQDISEAIRTTAGNAERGAARVQQSLEQVRTFGDTIKQLSTIVRENAAAVKQISVAVSQQNMGITQIVQAIGDLNGMMERTMERIQTTSDANSTLRASLEAFVTSVGALEQGPGAGEPLRVA